MNRYEDEYEYEISCLIREISFIFPSKQACIACSVYYIKNSIVFPILPHKIAINFNAWVSC